MTLRYPDSVSPEVSEHTWAPGITGEEFTEVSYESRGRGAVKGGEEKGTQAKGIL